MSRRRRPRNIIQDAIVSGYQSIQTSNFYKMYSTDLNIQKNKNRRQTKWKRRGNNFFGEAKTRFFSPKMSKGIFHCSNREI